MGPVFKHLALFQKPIKLNGVPLEPGKYAVWMDMSAEEFMPHELILEPYIRRFHTLPPPDADNMIRMPIERDELRQALGLIKAFPYGGEDAVKLDLTKDDTADLEYVAAWCSHAVLVLRK